MLSQAAQGLISLQRGGTYSLSRDALKHRVWDTRFFTAATVNDYTFFMQPIGSAWVPGQGNKTLNETNMYDTGKLPNGQVMIFTRMGIQCITHMALTGTNGDDLMQAFYTVLDTSLFEIKIQGREFDYQIHGSEFLPIVKVSGNTGATNVGYRVGDAITSGWSKLDPTPIVLDQLVSFQVLHRWAANPHASVVTVQSAAATELATAYCTMKVTLEGLLTRAK